MTEYGIALTFFVFAVLVIVWVVRDIYLETKRTADEVESFAKENDRGE